jgi:hypothetical protein
VSAGKRPAGTDRVAVAEKAADSGTPAAGVAGIPAVRDSPEQPFRQDNFREDIRAGHRIPAAPVYDDNHSDSCILSFPPDPDFRKSAGISHYPNSIIAQYKILSFLRGVVNSFFHN